MKRGQTHKLRPDGPFTSGQLSKMFGVSPRTFCKWADDGLIECYRIPSANGKFSGDGLHRRFTREAVFKFLERNPSLPRPDFFVVDAGTV